MKHVRRTLALLLAVLMLVGACSTAFAAKYTYATLKTGKWYKVPYSGRDTVYKLTLSADSAVTISWKGNKEHETYVRLCEDKACSSSLAWLIDEGSDTSGSEMIVLSKGTYYIQMYDYADNPSSQVKFTVKKATFKANYCRAKATVLKAKQTEKIYQTPDHCYVRWYKITVPKKKTVTINTNDEQAEYVTLYDSKMHAVECTEGSRTIITEDKVPKGTYYIRVSYSDYDIGDHRGQYITVKWH